MKLYIFILTFNLGLFGSLPQLDRVISLNRAEGYSPQIVHDNHLWLGRWKTGKENTDHHFLEVRDQSGSNLIFSYDTPHSVDYLFPFDNKRVLFTGKRYTLNGWRSYYSLASFNNGKFKIRTRQLPEQFQVEEFTGDSKNLFFNMVSDRTLIEVSAHGIRKLPLMISGPGMMAKVGDFIFVLERRSRLPGDEDVARVNLKDFKVERVFSSHRNGLLSLIALADGKTLVASESLEHQVLLIDSQTNRLKKIVSLPGTHPSSLAQLGHCLVVGSYAPTSLSLIDLKTPEPQLIDSYSLQDHKDDLPKIGKISVNLSAGFLFLRSIGFFFDDPETINSVYRYSNPDWLEKCS